jgi:hypothetical protein
VCDNPCQAARKPLILNGEMSEWLKEHAWKSTSAARADAHQDPPTQFRSTTSRNNDVRRRVLVNHGVCPGFRGVCDTVLTQKPIEITAYDSVCTGTRDPRRPASLRISYVLNTCSSGTRGRPRPTRPSTEAHSRSRDRLPGSRSTRRPGPAALVGGVAVSAAWSIGERTRAHGRVHLQEK